MEFPDIPSEMMTINSLIVMSHHLSQSKSDVPIFQFIEAHIHVSGIHLFSTRPYYHRFTSPLTSLSTSISTSDFISWFYFTCYVTFYITFYFTFYIMVLLHPCTLLSTSHFILWFCFTVLFVYHIVVQSISMNDILIVWMICFLHLTFIIYLIIVNLHYVKYSPKLLL
jgi:hypothetical protein